MWYRICSCVCVTVGHLSDLAVANCILQMLAEASGLVTNMRKTLSSQSSVSWLILIF
jgi:hypothetical protein